MKLKDLRYGEIFVVEDDSTPSFSNLVRKHYDRASKTFFCTSYDPYDPFTIYLDGNTEVYLLSSRKRTPVKIHLVDESYLEELYKLERELDTDIFRYEATKTTRNYTYEIYTMRHTNDYFAIRMEKIPEYQVFEPYPFPIILLKSKPKHV